jgi:hypothetical protein
MSSPVRKLLVVAASDGLVLEPTAGTSVKPPTPASNALVLAYGEGHISTRLQGAREESAKHVILEVHGIVGTETN